MKCRKSLNFFQVLKIQSMAAMPPYNEEKFIVKTITGARKHVDLVLVIDDCSSYTNAEIAGASGAIVVQHDVNSGHGGALQTIFDTARESEAEKLFILDADRQHNPDEISEFLIPLQQKMDFVIGSYFVGSAKDTIPDTRAFGVQFRKCLYGQ